MDPNGYHVCSIYPSHRPINVLDELKVAIANARAAGYEVECSVKTETTL